MKSLKQAFLYGFISWVIPFVVAMFIFSFRAYERPLFESVMAVTVAFAVMLPAYVYFHDCSHDLIREGVALGLMWFAINIVIDLALFMQGPMKMEFIDYLKDIGVSIIR
jgi:hypothetical protein